MPKKITLDNKPADRGQDSIFTGTPHCSTETARKVLKDKATKARDSLADSYIKKLLKAAGYTAEQINKNPQLIEDRRKEIKDKRDNPSQVYKTRKKEGFYRKRDITELKSGYVRGVIKASRTYKGEEITEEMIVKKREELLYERANGTKPGVVKQTPEERRLVAKNTSERRTKTLDDVYIRIRIKQSVNYKGEEVTDEMIKAHRATIEKYRHNQEKGVKALSYAAQLTDAYVKKVISLTSKIPKEQITDEQIVAKRAEIKILRVEKAIKAEEKKVLVEKRAELKAQREHDREEAAALKYKAILEEAAERRSRKLARLKAIEDKKRVKQEKKDAKIAKIREEKQRAADIVLERKLIEAAQRYKLQLQIKEEQKQKEKERLEKKEAKKKAKIAAKKLKRLAKKVKVVKTAPVYTFFTPHELRHQG